MKPVSPDVACCCGVFVMFVSGFISLHKHAASYLSNTENTQRLNVYKVLKVLPSVTVTPLLSGLFLLVLHQIGLLMRPNGFMAAVSNYAESSFFTKCFEPQRNSFF